MIDELYQRPRDRNPYLRPIYTLLLATLMGWVSYELFTGFSGYEAGGEYTTDVRLWFVYDVLGKWPPVLFFGICAALLVGYSGLSLKDNLRMVGLRGDY